MVEGSKFLELEGEISGHNFGPIPTMEDDDTAWTMNTPNELRRRVRLSTLRKEYFPNDK